MHTVRAKTQENVTNLNASGQISATLHRTNGKTSEVEIAIMIHTGHFSGFTTDQRATAVFTALCDAVNDAGRAVHVQFTCREIVEEEQRLCTLTYEVVHAHCNEVDANGINVARINRDAEFRANPVGSRNEDRILISRTLEVEQSTKTAQTRHNTRTGRAFRGRFDPFNKRIACVDIHTRVCVSQAVFLGHESPLASLPLR